MASVLERNLLAINNLRNTIGLQEQKRQERQTLDRITRALARGATDIETINEVSKEQRILEAANQPPTFDKGLGGIFQRLSSGFAPKSNIQQDIMGEVLERALATPTVSQQRAKSTIGLEPGTPEFEKRAGRTKTITPARPTAQTKEEKDFDRDIKILNDAHASGTKKGELKANRVQRQKALDRLKKQNLPDRPQGETGYLKNLEGKERVVVDTTGFNDKAFGEKAYNAALKEAKNDGLAKGFNEASVEADFNAWWDKQVEKEKGERFVEFVPRSEFQDISSAGIKIPTLTENILVRNKQIDPLDSLIEEFGGDEAAIRQAAKERNITISE